METIGRKSSLFTSAIFHQVHNGLSTLSILVPDQNLGKSSQEASLVLRWESVMMAVMWWHRRFTLPFFAVSLGVVHKELLR